MGERWSKNIWANWNKDILVKHVWKFDLVRKIKKNIIYGLKLSQNYVLHVSQYAHMMSSQGRVSQTQAFEINLADDNGIKLKDSYEFMVRQAGGRDVLGSTISQKLI